MLTAGWLSPELCYIMKNRCNWKIQSTENMLVHAREQDLTIGRVCGKDKVDIKFYTKFEFSKRKFRVKQSRGENIVKEIILLKTLDYDRRAQ